MSTNDKQIEQYRKAIETKRKELGAEPKPFYQTNQLLQFSSNENKQNLNLIRTVTGCVDVARQIQIQVMAHGKANELLGTDTILKINGYTADEWLSDIKARSDLLKWKSEKSKLDEMDKKLQQLLSEDAQTANAIANIASELGL